MTLNAFDIFGVVDEVIRSDKSNPYAFIQEQDEDSGEFYQDKRCVYSDEHGKHCIVGEVLRRLDLPIPRPGERENTKGIAYLLRYNWRGIGDFLDNDSQYILRRLQQDADLEVDGEYKNWREVMTSAMKDTHFSSLYETYHKKKRG